MDLVSSWQSLHSILTWRAHPWPFWYFPTTDDIYRSESHSDSHNGLSVNFTAALATFITSMLLLSWKRPTLRRDNKQDSIQNRKKAIHALLEIMTPTCSSWHSFYVTLCRNVDKAQTNVINIPLTRVLNDVLQGTVELRNPSEDLRALVRGRLHVDGWDILFTSGTFMWMDTLRWIVGQEFSAEVQTAPVKVQDYRSLVTHDAQTTNAATSPFAAPAPCMRDMYVGNIDLEDFLTCSSGNVLNCPSPDHVPRHSLGMFIRSIQGSFKSDHRPYARLDFTTFQAGLPLSSVCLVHYALPFLPRKYSRLQTTGSHFQPTSTPLLVPLHHIIALLNAGPDGLNILSVQNISVKFADALQRYAVALENDNELRRAVITDVGLKGWREEKILAHWEAALLHEEKLSRWVVLVKKDGH